MKKHYYRNLTTFFIVAIFFIFLFVEIPDTISVAGPPVVPFIYGKKLILTFYASVFFLIFIIVTKPKIKVDLVTILLAIHSIVYLVPLIYMNETSNFMTHYISILIIFISYVIGLNGNLDLKILSKLIMLMGLIISVQVLLTSLINQIPYNDLSYKYFMRIPLAASNVIAIYLVPSLFLVKYNIKNIFFKLVVYIILLSALILTKSRGGFLTFFIGLFIIFIESDKKFKIFYYLLIMVPIFILAYLTNNSFSGFINSFVLGFNQGSLNQITLDQFVSGRFSLIIDLFRISDSNYLFGNGFQFNEFNLSGSHNFIIDSFLQSGMVGTLLLLISIFIAFKVFKINGGVNNYGLKLYILLILVYSLYEVSFFNKITDFIFWFVLGTLNSYVFYKYNHKEVIESNEYR